MNYYDARRWDLWPRLELCKCYSCVNYDPVLGAEWVSDKGEQDGIATTPQGH